MLRSAYGALTAINPSIHGSHRCAVNLDTTLLAARVLDSWIHGAQPISRHILCIRRLDCRRHTALHLPLFLHGPCPAGSDLSRDGSRNTACLRASETSLATATASVHLPRPSASTGASRDAPAAALSPTTRPRASTTKWAVAPPSCDILDQSRELVEAENPLLELLGAPFFTAHHPPRLPVLPHSLKPTDTAEHNGGQWTTERVITQLVLCLTTVPGARSPWWLPVSVSCHAAPLTFCNET